MGVRKSWEEVENLGPLMGIRFARGPKVGPKVGPKRSDEDPKSWEEVHKACTPNKDSLRREIRSRLRKLFRRGPKGVRKCWDPIGEGLGSKFESMYTVIRNLCHVLLKQVVCLA